MRIKRAERNGKDIIGYKASKVLKCYGLSYDEPKEISLEKYLKSKEDNK